MTAENNDDATSWIAATKQQTWEAEEADRDERYGVRKLDKQNCGEMVLRFGKFKGYSLDDVWHIQKSYLRWLSAEADNLTFTERCNLSLFLNAPLPKRPDFTIGSIEF